MSIRDPKGLDDTRQMTSFRLPPELRAYVAEAAEAQQRDKTEIMCGALELDRDIGKKLGDVRTQLRVFAEEQGLSMQTDVAEVLAKLVRLGLEAHQIAKKARR